MRERRGDDAERREQGKIRTVMPIRIPESFRSPAENGGTVISTPARMTAAGTRSRILSLRRYSKGSRKLTNSGNEAKVIVPTATLERWIASRKAHQ